MSTSCLNKKRDSGWYTSSPGQICTMQTELDNDVPAFYLEQCGRDCARNTQPCHNHFGECVYGWRNPWQRFAASFMMALLSVGRSLPFSFFPLQSAQCVGRGKGTTTKRWARSVHETGQRDVRSFFSLEWSQTDHLRLAIERLRPRSRNIALAASFLSTTLQTRIMSPCRAIHHFGWRLCSRLPHVSGDDASFWGASRATYFSSAGSCLKLNNRNNSAVCISSLRSSCKE